MLKEFFYIADVDNDDVSTEYNTCHTADIIIKLSKVCFIITTICLIFIHILLIGVFTELADSFTDDTSILLYLLRSNVGIVIAFIIAFIFNMLIWSIVRAIGEYLGMKYTQNMLLSELIETNNIRNEVLMHDKKNA